MALSYTMKNMKVSRRDRGSMLVYVLLLMLVALTIGALWSQFAIQRLNGITFDKVQEHALYASDAGVDYALFLLNDDIENPNSLLSGGVIARNVVLPSGTVNDFEIDAVGGGGTTVAITSKGYFGPDRLSCVITIAKIDSFLDTDNEAHYYVSELEHLEDTPDCLIPASFNNDRFGSLPGI